MTKPKLSRREARWPYLFAEFNLDKINLIKGSIHVLGDASSRTIHDNGYEIRTTTLHRLAVTDEFKSNYEGAQVYEPILRVMQNYFPSNPIKSEQLRQLLPHFKLKEDSLFYDGNKCVPRRNVGKLLTQANDSK